MLLATIAMMLGCRNSYSDVQIASSATVSQQWTEIRPAQPLSWTKPAEEFSFHIDSPHQRSPQAEIIGPSGEHFVPQVEFVTTNGRTIAADTHGFWGEDMYFYWSKGGPGAEPIQMIRVRSSLPLNISKLVWRGYDAAKVKR